MRGSEVSGTGTSVTEGRLYLDTSVVVAAITREPRTEESHRLLAAGAELVISDWTVTEVSAALSMKQRVGALPEGERRVAQRTFERMAQDSFVVEHVIPSDFARAAEIADRSSPAVRAGAALHLALVLRTGSVLATFDSAMAKAAAEHGVRVLG